MSSGRGKTAGCLEASDGRLQSVMDEIAECESVEQQRIFGLARLVPVKGVLPKIAERIAQQFDERGRRLLALKRTQHDGVIMANEPVMGCQSLSMPIDPAGRRGFRFR
jgi:hypothetical protein